MRRRARGRVPLRKRSPRFKKRQGNPSSVTIARLENFYDFHSWKDVTRDKMRLQDGLDSSGVTRLPTAILFWREGVGAMRRGDS